MELNTEQKRFLATRRRYVRIWPVVGGILLGLVACFSVWLFFHIPLLANPFVVFSKLNTDAIPKSTLALMAAMLPLVFLTCVVLVIALLLLVFAACSIEKQYLGLLEPTTEPGCRPAGKDDET